MRCPHFRGCFKYTNVAFETDKKYPVYGGVLNSEVSYLVERFQCISLSLSSHTAPYEPPQNIQHTILDSRTVRLDWEPPLSPNGVISTYTILWNDIQTNELLKINRLSFSYTLTDLHPYYIYQYNISAHTVDYGPYSNITTIQMPEDSKSMKL